ncbi:MAG TPA: penicillin-binding protein activator LpoB [bacterium]|nr:penicillin-binding protein activator LpoB [bacterium]
MKKFLVVAVAISLAFLMAACAGTSVKRVDEHTITDLSGRWNDTDAQSTAEKMIEEMLNRPWLRRYMRDSGKEPRIIVGEISNRTDEHIDVMVFRKEIENELTNAGDVIFVASATEREEIRAERADMQEYASDDTRKKFKREKAADFMLKGVLTSIPDQAGGTKAIYYQVNLELFNTETNEKAWVGQHKIKKVISRSRFGL